MSQGKSGSLGWVLSGKDGKQFCKAKVSLAVVDKKTLVSILGSGRMVKVDRATFEASLGGPDPSLPLLSDLKAGRVGPQHVGAARRCAADLSAAVRFNLPNILGFSVASPQYGGGGSPQSLRFINHDWQ